MKILIVDDNEGIRCVLRDIFKEHNVVTASDGEIGLKIFFQESFDLVISDMIMPRMRGEELIKKIKSSNPMVKTIIMSTLTGEEVRRVAKAAGADYFVDKFSLLSDLNSALKNLFAVVPQ